MDLPAPDTRPRYERVKDHVRDRIAAGEWPPGTRLPSENELGPMLGVSRITISRAFAELARQGLVRKVQGLGTFVAERRPRFGLAELQDVAEEIAARGMAWSCTLRALRSVPAPAEAAALLDLAPGEPVFESEVLHRGDGVPIQLEHRTIRRDYLPRYLEQDFAACSTYSYLQREGRAEEMEQSVTAVLPDPALRALLKVDARECCLVIRRRTFRAGRPTTLAVLTQPASRFEISGRYRLTDPT
ncbi:GntR family transcriptional regulator [Roseomonas sp. OT10]|uniref:UTRA domain-containing protein n=1 Tax=Roseomonas cutis TaxID=2897332 RepID=UPI001E4FC48D|nr:UTRA domain-containing protein [Roseomonas sp. OT10]UFN51073.1 GntR family transcriptional regulator [Roseomonas sp. OT10]